MGLQEQTGSPSTLKIDHVTTAGSELASMERAFASLGLATDYGGPHSNGVTHMALLGFKDGSYLELISSLQPGQKDATFWGEHIVGNGGPCAWAVQVDDVAAEAARISSLGIPVSGPAYYHRRRPDGVLVEWDLAFLDDKGAGTVLPFIIKDITPREWRVRPSASVVNGPLTGIAAVTLGVQNLESSIELFRQVYGWAPPSIADDATFGAKMAYFMKTPVILASPLDDHSWLSERLIRFGESPCAYLIGTEDFEAAGRHFGLTESAQWFDRLVAWFDPVKLNGLKLGIISA